MASGEFDQALARLRADVDSLLCAAVSGLEEASLVEALRSFEAQRRRLDVLAGQRLCDQHAAVGAGDPVRAPDPGPGRGGPLVGQTVIILMRQIDLSISSIVGITAFLSGTLFVNHPGIPGVVVVLLAILAGLLLGAVNAVRATTGQSAVTWAGILPNGVPVPAINVLVYAAHVTAIRNALDTARSAIPGLPLLSFSNPVSNDPITAALITQLQGGAR